MSTEPNQQPQSPKQSAPPRKPYGDKPNTGTRPQDQEEPATSDPVDGGGARNPSDRSAAAAPGERRANASPGATPKDKEQPASGGN
ncbi:MAG: hypothetical protein JSS29_17910 [Proteobacteria bacterium]|nr:hypothetical protein [Pseudomonadota bacterium]